jgi:DNA-binding transcriptional ArsR family regulator
MIINNKHVKPPYRKAEKGLIRYNPETCTYSVPDSQLRRLQCKYPYDDIQAAIVQAGRHTKRYSENARQAIEANPHHALEFDLECWLFAPKPQQQPRTLSELARQIKLCPTFVREALTGEINAKLAARDLAKFYPRYYELGGTGFEPTHNATVDLVSLLKACGEEKKLPRLQEIDVKILKHLNAAEFARKLGDLEAELNVPRVTVGKRLKILRALGLTHRPKGQKGGDAISAPGKNFLKTL